MSMSLVQTVTIGAGGNTMIGFNNIPQVNGHLILVAALRGTNSTNNLSITLNNDTSTNYDYRLLQAAGSSQSTWSTTNAGFFSQAMNDPAAPTAAFGSLRCIIPRYTSAIAKTALIDGVTAYNSTTNGPLGLVSARWNNSSAVTSLQIRPDSGSFVQHSTASLYILASA